MQDILRVIILLGAVVTGTLVLAWTSAYIFIAVESPNYAAFFVYFATIVGLYVAAAVSLIVVPLLWQTRWLRSLAFVYGWSLVPVVVWSHLLPGASSAIVAFVSVVALSAVARFRYRYRKPGVCPRCEYDLQGNPDSGCPECGWKRADEPAQAPP